MVLLSGLYVWKAAADDGTVGAGQHFISIHDRGVERGIITDAPTLREALAKEHIAIGENDLVEPGLDEQLVAENYQVNIYRARPVIVIDGASSYKVLTPYQTSKQIAEDAGLKLQDEDETIVEPVADMASYGAGLQVSIDRATPFNLVLYGKRLEAYSQEATVAAMLRSKDITLAANDTLSIGKSEALVAGMTVEIWHNGLQTVTQDESIAFETERIQDADREVGYKEVKTPGVNGKKSVTYEVEMRNGQEVARTELQSVVTEQPKKQVEVVGAKLTNTFSGSFAEALARLRACESGGNYANKNNPKYRGAYQYDYSTWANYQGFYDPADAPPAVQDEKAWQTYQRRGWQPWPSCSKSQGLQDIYR